MKKYLIFIFCYLFGLQVYSQLPSQAKKFIDTYYSNIKITNTTVDMDYANKIDDYEVYLFNGTKLEFDRLGYIKTIECSKTDTVNYKILPAKIQAYLQNQYPNSKVVEYHVDDRGRRYEEHEIELSNGLELTFNRRFKLTNKEY